MQSGAADCENGTSAAGDATVNGNNKMGVGTVYSGAVNTVTVDSTRATTGRKDCELGWSVMEGWYTANGDAVDCSAKCACIAGTTILDGWAQLPRLQTVQTAWRDVRNAVPQRR